MTDLVMGILLAEEPNRGPDYGKASPVGLLVVLLLLVAVFFLWRSMGRQLKKVPASFDVPGGATAGAAGGVVPTQRREPAATGTDPVTSPDAEGHGTGDNETTARGTGG